MAAASISLLGCSMLPTETQLKVDPFTPQERADIYESTIAANLAENKKDYATAFSYYIYAARLSKDIHLIEKSVQAALAIQDPLAMDQAASLWLEVEPNNQKAQLIRLDVQIKNADLEKADAIAADIFNESIPEEEQYSLLKTNIINNNPKTLLSFLQKSSQRDPKNAAFITMQADVLYRFATREKSATNLYTDALYYTDKALSINPVFMPAVDIKINALYAIKKHNEAKSYLTELFSKYPQSSEINQMLGQLLYDLKNYSECADHYNRWLSSHPDDSESRYFLAASHFELGQYELSLSHFQQLIKIGYQPNIAAYYSGISANQLDQSDKAIDYFKQVKSGELLAPARIQIAKTFVKQQQPEHALAILRMTADLLPKDQTKLIIAEIDLLNQAFSADQAKKRLEAAIQEQPDNITLLLKKIDLYQLIQKPNKLYKLLEDARELISSDKKINRFNLLAAELLNNNKHYRLAINWLDSAILESPNNKTLLYTRALYKEPLGLFQEMVKELKHLNQLYPDDANIKNALGYSLADLNQELDFAQALIDSAYQALPNSSAVIDSKGWVAYRRGDLDAAQEYLIRAFKIQPSAETAAHLGEVLWKKSLTIDAKSVWLQGLKIDPDNKVLLDTLKRFNVKL
jgi:tetratricopeptide (TPR) repeat protein